jgi:propanol-preferring alcohol dehydrogenase
MCVVKPNSLGVYCDGGYADHMTVPHPKYLLEPERARSRHRGALCLLRRHHLQRAEEGRIRLQLPIVIFGAGGLGLMALSLLKAMGGKGAIVVDIDARKREAAEAAGALATVDGKAPDALEQLRRRPAGRSAR